MHEPRASGLLREFQCSSASRKFLNVCGAPVQRSESARFQCSSASRKFLNDIALLRSAMTERGFSALQRAENSSIALDPQTRCVVDGFSALQRAENSSIRVPSGAGRSSGLVSVLFSEPKIPQSSNHVPCAVTDTVSVLFSEPKIPQCVPSARRGAHPSRFSALQRAENSSIEHKAERRIDTSTFQCSSASRKFLNPSRSRAGSSPHRFQCSSASRKFLNNAAHTARRSASRVSVLFSEPKIPQSYPIITVSADCTCFSALQRAENSSICSVPAVTTTALPVSVLFSEPKIPQSALIDKIAWFVERVSVLFSEPKIPQYCDYACSIPRLGGFSALQRAENSSIFDAIGDEGNE